MSFGFGLGFPKARQLAGGPSLNFQFAGSTKLDPLITFSRPSGATWFNSAGVLQGIDFSVTSNTIGTGSKTFTLDATAGVNRYWAAGDTVLISQQSNSANNMTGTVTSYTASTQVLVVNVTSTGGSGTIASWRIGSTMPRFDYNPATLAARGLLIEESRTNSIRNNTMQGAVAGTPGTLPTNWAGSSPIGGLTREVVGTGTVNGINYIDLRFSGTTSATSANIVFFEQNTFVAALNGQSWSVSAWLAVVGGSFTNITASNLVLRFNDSGGTFLSQNTVSFLSATGSLVRYAASGTASNASTAFVTQGITLGFASGVAIDITLRIGLPQLENNNIATGVASATVVSGGSGYAVGDVLQIVGGTVSTAARLTVATLSGSAVATVTVSTAGLYTTFPSPQPVSVTAITGTGSSATFNIVPQAQNGVATSVIPTTTTALTRNGDSATVSTLAPWFNATEGTLFAEGSVGYTVPGTIFPLLASLNDGTSSNRIETGYLTSTLAGFEVAIGGVTQANIYPATVAVTRKVAGTYKANDFAACVNGGTVGTDTTGSIPVVDRLRIGDRTGFSSINGWIRRVVYYPRRLSNAELQSITS